MKKTELKRKFSPELEIKAESHLFFYYLSEEVDNEENEYYTCAMPQVILDHGIGFPEDVTFYPLNKEKLKEAKKYLRMHSLAFDKICLFNNSPLIFDFYQFLMKTPLKYSNIKLFNMNPAVFIHKKDRKINGYIN